MQSWKKKPEKKLDFGLGCELPNGNIVSGKIHLTYSPVQNGTRTINYTFEDFVINEKSIEGGGTIFRERYNASGNPQSTFHNNILITPEIGLPNYQTVFQEVHWSLRHYAEKQLVNIL